MGRILIPTSIGFVVLAAGWWYMSRTVATPAPEQLSIEQGQQTMPSPGVVPEVQSAVGADDNLVEFRCDDGKRITAVFLRDIVGVTLSDGRQMELRQTINGNDISYHNADGTVQFLGKGEGGALIEGGVTTYANCVAMI